MADGMAILVLQNIQIYWCEGNWWSMEQSHSTPLERLGWAENKDAIVRHFCRVQIVNYRIEGFEFDEGSYLPSWAEVNRQEIVDKCEKALLLFKPIRDEYWKQYNVLEKTQNESCLHGCIDPMAAVFNQQVADAWKLAVKALILRTIELYKRIDGYVPPSDDELTETFRENMDEEILF
jgi:hypothetical protein